MSILSKKHYKRLHLEYGRNICNYNCLFCYKNQNKLESINDKLNKNVLNQILDFCRGNIVDEFFIQGGEITIMPDIYAYLCKFIQKTKTKINTSTNGSNFNQAWADLFIKHGLEVNFSINSANKMNYEKLSGGGNLEKVLENIIRFQTIKESNNKNNCITAISMVVTTENINELEHFYNLGVALKADTIKFYPDITSPYKLSTNDNSIISLWHNAYRKLIKIIANNKKPKIYGLDSLANQLAYKTTNNSIIAAGNLTDLYCKSPWNSIFIDNYLNVFPCCNNNLPWGNIQKTSLTNILKSKNRINMQNCFKNNKYLGCLPGCDLLYKYPLTIKK